MRRILALLLAVLSALCCLCVLPASAAAAEAVQAAPAGGDFAPGEALVLFDAAAAYASAAPAAYGMERSAQGGLFGAQVGVEKIYDFPQGAALNRAAQAGEEALAIALVNGMGMDTAALLSHLEGLDFVRAAEPNYRIYPDALFNDPYTDEQWGIVLEAGVHPEALWDAAFLDSVVVAVVDTGVDYLHPDLQGRVVDEALFFDAYSDGGQKAMDYDGHGTHVAGIIAAHTNNGTGVAGVAGEAPVKILPVKVFSPMGSFVGDLVAGIHHVIQTKYNGTNIVAANMSLGGNWHSSEIVSYAMTKLGEAEVLAVRSAGNSGLDVDAAGVYPSYFENPYTVSVAAIEAGGQFDAGYSNHGEHSVHIAAPGTAILSTWPRGRGSYVENGKITQSESFENSGASYDWGYTWERAWPAASDAVVLNGAQPVPGGYNSSYSLGFDALQSSGYYYYYIDLPGNMGTIPAGESLSLRLSVEGGANGFSAALVRDGEGISWGSYDAGRWSFLSAYAETEGEYRLVLYCGTEGTGEAPLHVRIDDVCIYTSDYASIDGTSMAAPHAAGAYALISAALPTATMAERRARLLGSARYHESLKDRVNTQGTVDLRRALHGGAFLAPVIDSIEQNGDRVTVKGWFWGGNPSFTLGGRSVAPASIREEASGACTMTFSPGGTSGVQTLTVTKTEGDMQGRSYRMRYDYSPQGNMTIRNPNCPVPSDAMSHDLFACDGHIFHLMNTVGGYTVGIYGADGSYLGSGGDKDCAPRATRDDFATFVDEDRGILYIYDIDHIHRYDMKNRAWLADIAGPYSLDLNLGGFSTGAVAVYGGKLMVIGGEGQDGSGFVWSTPLAGPDEQGSTPAWTQTPLPAGFPEGPARAVALGGKLIVFSQRTSTITGTSFGYVYRYDGEWTPLISGDTDKANLWRCSFAVYGDEILLFGNYNDAEEGHSIRAYRPANSTWRYLPWYGTGLAYSIRGAVLDGRIYGLTAVQDFSRFILQSVDVLPPEPAPAPAPGSGWGGGDADVAIEFYEGKKAQQAEEIVPATPPATGGAQGSGTAFFAAAACLFPAALRMRKKKPRKTPRPLGWDACELRRSQP